MRYVSLLLMLVFALLITTNGATNDAPSGVNNDSADTTHSESHFPQVSGRNIDGVPHTLPEDFEGRYNVVLIAFTREHQRSVDTWLPALRVLEERQPSIRIYELPSLPEFSWFRRKQLDFWMSAGISDPLARATTITLYTDLERLNQALDIPDMRSIRIFLIDRQGAIYWREQGSMTTQKLQALEAVLQQEDPNYSQL